MLALQQAQAEAAAKAASRRYSSGGGNSSVSTSQGGTDITKTPVFNKVKTMFDNGADTQSVVTELESKFGMSAEEIQALINGYFGV